MCIRDRPGAAAAGGTAAGLWPGFHGPALPGAVWGDLLFCRPHCPSLQQPKQPDFCLLYTSSNLPGAMPEAPPPSSCISGADVYVSL